MVLLLDEAQALPDDSLEALRLLTNLETNQRKLLQIIILGQPELLDILARPEMRQLAQRITARFHLSALTLEEVRAYIAHRLAVAGQNVQLFPEASLRRLFRLSKGIPRLINIICDRALLGCYVQNIYNVDMRTLNTAAKEVFGELKNVETRQQRKHWPLYLFILIMFLSSAALTYWYKQNTRNTTTLNAASSAPLSEIESEIPLTVPTIEASENEITETPGEPLAEYINRAGSNSMSDAYRALFTLWQMKYYEQQRQDACSIAETQGMSCLHRQGNLNSIKHINIPVVLQVYNNDGSDASITLKKLDHKQAVLMSGTREFSVPIETLEAHWYGEYSVLWKMPPYYSDALQTGARGPTVQWLDQQLARLQPDSSTTIRDDYTPAMAERVADFQRSVGLPADGIAGPMTFIHLNNALGYPAPHLLAITPEAE